MHGADREAQKARSSGWDSLLARGRSAGMADAFDPKRSRGLFVGVRKFETKWAELPFAVDDAVDLAYLFSVELRLLEPSGVALCLSGPAKKPESKERLRHLLKSGSKRTQATWNKIYESLERQTRQVGREGVFVALVATHGFSARGEDHLVTKDCGKSWKWRGVEVSQFIDMVYQTETKRQLLMFDACRERLYRGRRSSGQPGSTLQAAIVQAAGLVVLNAAARGGYAYDDDERGNGVFSAAIIDGLRGEAPVDDRGFITAVTLAQYVNQRVGNWLRRRYPGEFRDFKGIHVTLEGEACSFPLAVGTHHPASPDASSATDAGTGSRFPRQETGNFPRIEISDSAAIEFVEIPPGEFKMGSGDIPDARPVRTVEITRGFQLGRYPVTQAQWGALMGNPQSHFQGPCQPVEQVSWDQVQEFLEKLNQRGDGWRYRLPTEAEWEYAARAGTTGDYAGTLNEMAWCVDNAHSHRRTDHVGNRRKPNSWGLYDMHGNVWEWVQDWYGAGYYASRPDPDRDPCGPAAGGNRVIRGGSWCSPSQRCRSAVRDQWGPGDRSFDLGFRLLRHPLQSSPS